MMSAVIGQFRCIGGVFDRSVQELGNLNVVAVSFFIYRKPVAKL